ncbi:flagellar hook-basal body complex protein FliE [Burkholderia sp. L27(2015)]|jgi:flagellar hook-basal body complex protein FliE|uniref:flagellar hook-basal body complex protein FliE n=1 Tax=Burkholderia sp. L27(2015) TaxID=1641858 RepID=UPI00131BD137|nr:flagellar hook-basal body complex protein FliE [Burkholderia sp. L27(2015)]
MVPSINPMASVLQEMQSMAGQADGPDATAAAGAANSASSGGTFASMLQDSLAKVSQAQQNAGAEGQAFELGSPNVALNDVMLDGQKANIEFQTALQVRNKLVTAYNDVMQMSV